MTRVKSLEVEKEVIALLFSSPESYSDLGNFQITESDFTAQNKIIFSVCDSLLKAGETLSASVVISRLNNLGIKSDTIDYPTYVEGLSQIPVSKHSGPSLFKELKLIAIRNHIIKNCEETIAKMAKGDYNTLGDVVKTADDTYNKYVNVFNENSQIVSITDNFERIIEDRGNNPVDFIGLKGPFDNINNIYGSLSRDAAITMVAARSGVGKTKMGMFYNLFLAEKYNLPILHMDFGEMTYEELIWRFAACFVNDEVPMHFLETGKWRRVPEYVDKVRKIGIPRARKLKIFYIDVSDMTPMDIISVIRRYSYNEAGRDNKFLINYDYLKPFDPSGESKDDKEFALMGKFMKQIKSFLKNEMPMPFWCSIQQNRNVYQKSGVDDSSNSISISDRIYQQTNHTFILRYKSPLEIAEDGIEFGNAKAVFIKTRSLGELADDAFYVKTEDGQFLSNYINIHIKGFTFEDRGSLIDVLKARGRKSQNLAQNPPKDKDLL